MGSVRQYAKKLKCQTTLLVLVMRHPGTPWYAKALGFLPMLYLLSPIQLIPNFIPVIGYLDDLLVASLGIWLVKKLTPATVWSECAAKTEDIPDSVKNWWGGVILVVSLLILLLAMAFWLLGRP
jgi:uncharacterized membrane protein YkvA (DUF1232 family)